MSDSRPEDCWMLPIRISVQRWSIPLSEQDRNLLEYALYNASDELLRHPLPGATVRIRYGTAVLLFDLPAKVQILSGIEHRCRLLRRIAKAHFYAELQIVIGDTVPMRQLPAESRDVAHSAGNAEVGSPDDNDLSRFMRQARDSDDASLQRILSYVDENLAEHLTREDIAHKVHFHPAYLSRYFRKKTGLSLSEYIMLKRISYAKELLSGSEMKVSHIMSYLGYDNLSHFTRTFKRMTGCTPQQYRRNKPLH